MISVVVETTAKKAMQERQLTMKMEALQVLVLVVLTVVVVVVLLLL